MSDTNQAADPAPAKGKWFRNRWLIGGFAFVLGAAAMRGVTAMSGVPVASAPPAQVAELQTKLDAANAQIAALNAAPAVQAPAAVVATEPATPPPPPAPTTFSDGTYLVGTDLPAGRYKGSPSGGDGYWQISKDANGDNIISNNNVSGSFYVQVKKGQYLELDGVEIHKVK